MDIAMYQLSDVEKWIDSIYNLIGINSIQDLDIDFIAEKLGIDIVYYSGRSFVDWIDSKYVVIFLNNQISLEKRREVFFHELCHPLRHAGLQRMMPRSFVSLQEKQAMYFQLYAAMPIYLIKDLPVYQTDKETIGVWAEEFKLPHSLVTARLEQIKVRIATAAAASPKQSKAFDDSPMFPPSQYSKETNDLIMKAFKLNEYRRFEVQLVWR